MVKTTYVCDGCGKEEVSEEQFMYNNRLPKKWYIDMRVMQGNVIIIEPITCSKECAKVAMIKAIEKWK